MLANIAVLLEIASLIRLIKGKNAKPHRMSGFFRFAPWVTRYFGELLQFVA